MTKATEKADQVKLTDEDLEIVAGGNKPGGNKPKHDRLEYMIVTMKEVIITSVQ